MYNKKNKLSQPAPILIKISPRLSRAVYRNNVNEKCVIFLQNTRLRGSSDRGELARLDGLTQLGEMIFIPHSYAIFYLNSIRNFVMSLEKDYLIK